MTLAQRLRDFLQPVEAPGHGVLAEEPNTQRYRDYERLGWGKDAELALDFIYGLFNRAPEDFKRRTFLSWKTDPTYSIHGYQVCGENYCIQFGYDYDKGSLIQFVENGEVVKQAYGWDLTRFGAAQPKQSVIELCRLLQNFELAGLYRDDMEAVREMLARW